MPPLNRRREMTEESYLALGRSTPVCQIWATSDVIVNVHAGARAPAIPSWVTCVVFWTTSRGSPSDAAFRFGDVRMGNFTSSTTGSLSSTSCVQYVQEVVTQNCVVIFSKSTCPYCKMAKNVFNEIGANYKVVELDEHNDGRRLQEALAQVTGARTVPRVFINGNCIGGGSDTKQLHQQGRLVPLIKQCAPCCSSAEGSASGQFAK